MKLKIIQPPVEGEDEELELSIFLYDEGFGTITVMGQVEGGELEALIDFDDSGAIHVHEAALEYFVAENFELTDQESE